MTGTWIGKTRSLGLWSNIDKYVKQYSAVNNITDDEPWLKRWNELINVHKIMKKKRDFEFISYVITGNPEATVIECLQHLFSLIPFLDQHIDITATNDNGNIQYIYHEDPIKAPSPKQTQISSNDNNRYATLDRDNDNKDLESILNSDHSSDTQQHGDNNDVYDQALDSAPSTLQKLSDFATNPDASTNQSSFEDYIAVWNQSVQKQ